MVLETQLQTTLVADQLAHQLLRCRALLQIRIVVAPHPSTLSERLQHVVGRVVCPSHVRLRPLCLVGRLSIVEENLRVAYACRQMLLVVVDRWIQVDVAAHQLAQVVARQRGSSVLAVQSVQRSGIGSGIDGRATRPLLLAIDEDVGLQPGVAPLVWMAGIVARSRGRDGIAIGHRESIDQVLRGVHAPVAIERRRIIVGLQRVVLLHVAPPHQLRRVGVGGPHVIDGRRDIPLPSVLRHASHTAAVLQAGRCQPCSLVVGHGPGRRVGRRGGEERHLRLQCSDDAPVDLAAVHAAKGTVVLSIGAASTLVLVRHVARSHVAILFRQILQRLVQVGHDLVDTLLEGVAGEVEVARRVFRLQVDRHAQQHAVDLSAVSPQEIVEMQGSESIGIAPVVVLIHFVQHAARVAPLHLVAVFEHQVAVLYGMVAHPLAHGVHRGRPRSCCHALILVAAIVGHGIVGGHVGRRILVVGQQQVGIVEQAACEGRVAIHLVQLQVVLQCRLEEVGARGEHQPARTPAQGTCDAAHPEDRCLDLFRY